MRFKVCSQSINMESSLTDSFLFLGGKSNTTELTNPSYPPPYVNVSTGLPPLTKDDIPNILPPSYHDVVSNSKCQETL